MINTIKPLAEEFMSHCQKKYGFKHPPKINFVDDGENAQDPLGKTAHYDTQDKSITLYITNRHPKDILRSLAHELTHHLQNLRGEFDDVGELGEGYAQNDEHMRNMEIEAYASGIDVRDWADSKNNIQKENKTMNAKQEALLRALIKEQIKKVLGKLKEGGLPSPYPEDEFIPGQDDDMEPSLDAWHAEEEEASHLDQYGNDRTAPGYDHDVDSPLRKRRLREEEEEVEEGYKGSQFEDEPGNSPLTPEERERFSQLRKKYIEAGYKYPDYDIPDPEWKRLLRKYHDSLSTEFELGMPEKTKADSRRLRQLRKANQDEIDLAHDKEAAGIKEDNKVVTPEQEQTLYESRFTMRDTKIFEKLLKKWAN